MVLRGCETVGERWRVSSGIDTVESFLYLFFFFNDTATTEIYTLSLHDALPISHRQGWDEVSCQIPAAEMQDMIQELRSATMGVGSYESSFDHLQQLNADETRKIVAA